MTFTEFEALVAAVKYKPNVTVSLWYGYAGEGALRLTFTVPNRDSPRRELTEVTHHTPLPPLETFRGPLDALKWLRMRIHYAEMHEADEWLEVEGERPFYPHAGEKERDAELLRDLKAGAEMAASLFGRRRAP